VREYFFGLKLNIIFYEFYMELLALVGESPLINIIIFNLWVEWNILFFSKKVGPPIKPKFM